MPLTSAAIHIAGVITVWLGFGSFRLLIRAMRTIAEKWLAKPAD